MCLHDVVSSERGSIVINIYFNLKKKTMYACFMKLVNVILF